MEDRALADRMVNYADALVAVSFVGTSGLSLALGDPDVRCSLTQGFAHVLLGNLLFAVVVSALFVVLRLWETDLRSEAPLSAKSARYSRRLHAVRLAVVWLSATAAVGVLLAGTRDPACLV